MKTNRKIDHIVLAVRDLDEAVLKFEKETGVRPVFGGYHKTEGTMNALVNLSNGVYLELLAIDYSNKDITKDRWMGIESISDSKITRWALKTDDIKYDSDALKDYNSTMGEIKGGQRQMTNGATLSWMLAMPLSTPEVELVPFITDWQSSDVHPTDSLEVSCELIGLHLFHPQPTTIQPILEKLGWCQPILSAASPRINIHIRCPKGIVEL